MKVFVVNIVEEITFNVNLVFTYAKLDFFSIFVNIKSANLLRKLNIIQMTLTILDFKFIFLFLPLSLIFPLRDLLVMWLLASSLAPMGLSD